MNRNYFLFFISVLFTLLTSFILKEDPADDDPPFLILSEDHWVKEKMDSMTLDEKIAQLMMITVYPRQTDADKERTIRLIRNYKPGGILVMQGSPVKTATWINQFQENSTIPLLVAIDGEWGLSMRIDSTVQYPYAQALGAVQDSIFLLQMGRDLAQQMKLAGIHMNFAPVADVSTNPQNPVINFRSFGEDKVNVSQKAWHIASGMQNEWVIPVAKHFPGHGDTETDSHKELPLIKHSKERIDAVESFPFRYLSQKGINGIMTAHLNVPALDHSDTPSSLSKKIVTGYLRNEIGYKGFVITDAMNMQGVQTQKGNAIVEALKAGNDMLEFVPDLTKAVAAVKQAVAAGEITVEEIDEKCTRVLALKRWAGLHVYQPANTASLTARMNSPYFEITVRKLIKGSLTVLSNRNALPVQEFSNLKIASVMIGTEDISAFQKMLGRYAPVDHFSLKKNASEREVAALRTKLSNYNLVIAGIQGINLYPSGMYGTTMIQRSALADFIRDTRVISVFFGNAYALKHFENIHQSAGLILAYQNNRLTQELAAQLVFGAFDASGKLPVTVDNRFKLMDGMDVKGNQTFSYTIPEETGILSDLLTQKIDSLAELGLRNKAYPGAQVLIARHGNVVFHKCYGYHTYFQEQEVTPDDIYDWASVTKVTGPLPAIIKLTDEKKINLDAPLSTYWPAFKGNEKGNIHFRDYLTHQARLPAFIPFWRMGLEKDGSLRRDVFSFQPTEEFSVRVSSQLYINNNYRQVIYDAIRDAKPLPAKKYVYSDLGFHLYPEMISALTGIPYEKYIADNFFTPLGASTVTYNPYLHFPLDRIIPTETDDFFRKEKLHGFVHDEGAAMLGGVSGNAGLFGTASDLAKIIQMYLQKGYFAGRRYFSEETMNEFTKIQFPQNNNRRALGFDKPYINNHKNSLKDAYPAVSASKNSFGHTGYTGIMVWADPDSGILFIFMSNRVHPTRNNSALFDLNIRPAMHQAIYDSMVKPAV
jgi:beta-N-acetylhexosaminidase